MALGVIDIQRNQVVVAYLSVHEGLGLRTFRLCLSSRDTAYRELRPRVLQMYAAGYGEAEALSRLLALWRRVRA